MNQNRRLTVPNRDRPWQEKLSPQLAHAYALLPSAMSSPIAGLVEKALLLRIHPNLLVQYAFLHVSAEHQAKGDAASMDHALRSRAEIAGELHRMKNGYWESAEAVQRYRGGRKARQQVSASLEGVLTGWKKAEQIVRRHRSELPLHLQPRFSDESLTGVRRLVMELHNAALLDQKDALRETGREQGLSEIAQTYVWWRFAMASYRGKWSHMHRLAVVWKLSSANDESIYRTVVCRLCKGIPYMRYPFGSGWESILSGEIRTLPGPPSTPVPKTV